MARTPIGSMPQHDYESNLISSDGCNGSGASRFRRRQVQLVGPMHPSEPVK
jgi:hypothetical protein